MTATATKTRPRSIQQTWKDWAGPSAPDPPELITRDELVRDLVDDGVDVTSGDLVFWQSKGVLPYPVKHRRDGVTQAYYAPWVAQLVRELRRLQDEGRRLQDIRPTLQHIAEALAHGRPVPHIIQVPTATAIATAYEPTLIAVPTRAAISEGAGGGSGTLTVTQSPMPPALQSLATAFAQVYQDRYGTPVDRMEIRLFDDRGNPVLLEFATG